MTDTPDDAELDYAYLTQDALRGVVREVLMMTQALGHPPGEHHFYVEFGTNSPGVQISDRLKAQYPERMTVVLQHQFEALEVDDEGFAVTLHFGGSADRLIVPFAAVTQFADPSASFALQFSGPVADDDDDDTPSETADVAPLRLAGQDAKDRDGGTNEADTGDGPGDDEPDPTPPAGSTPGGSAEVVSLDRFRKK